eukprot:7378050-Prymnesium_polylepis.1
MAAARLQPTLPPLPTSRIFFTNFFISRVAWWDEPAVHRFLDAVNASGGIYDHRWGDAPLQTAAVRLHAAPASVLHIDMDYVHMSTRNRIVRGEEVPFAADGIADAHFRRLAATAMANASNASVGNVSDGSIALAGGPSPSSTGGSGSACPD